MSNCHEHVHSTSSVFQTLDELDFERGIWSAAHQNELIRVRKLLEQGTNVDVQDKSGYTALHYAARNGHLNICEVLIAHGANVNSLTRAGRATALHRSASAGHLDVLNLLVRSGAEVDLKDADGKTVLHRAVESGHAHIVEAILKFSPKLVNEADNSGHVPGKMVTSSIPLGHVFAKTHSANEPEPT